MHNEVNTLDSPDSTADNVESEWSSSALSSDDECSSPMPDEFGFLSPDCTPLAGKMIQLLLNSNDN